LSCAIKLATMTIVVVNPATRKKRIPGLRIRRNVVKPTASNPIKQIAHHIEL